MNIYLLTIHTVKLSLLLISLLLLSSCTIDWNDGKDKKIAELEKQITELKWKNDDGLFKKKQDCLQTFKKLYPDELSTEMFYSEKTTSCFAVIDKWVADKRVFAIYDILSQKIPYSFTVDKNWNIKSKKNLMESDLDKLKCEFDDVLSELWGDDYFNTECSYIGN